MFNLLNGVSGEPCEDIRGDIVLDHSLIRRCVLIPTPRLKKCLIVTRDHEWFKRQEMNPKADLALGYVEVSV